MGWYQVRKEGISLSLRIQPRSSRNKIAGLLGEELKIALTAPPVDGEANEACHKFLSKFFGKPLKYIHLESGHTGRSKRVFIEGLVEAELLELVKEFID